MAILLLSIPVYLYTCLDCAFERKYSVNTEICLIQRVETQNAVPLPYRMPKL